MIYLLVGIATGMLSGLFGVGGGIILVPALLSLGLKTSDATGISLAVIVPTALVGAYRHYQYNQYDLKVAFFVICGAVAGALLGVWLHRHFSSQMFTRAFGILMVVVGINIIVKTFNK